MLLDFDSELRPGRERVPIVPERPGGRSARTTRPEVCARNGHSATWPVREDPMRGSGSLGCCGRSEDGRMSLEVVEWRVPLTHFIVRYCHSTVGGAGVRWDVKGASPFRRGCSRL
jgi:hypothetical protein